MSCWPALAFLRQQDSGPMWLPPESSGSSFNWSACPLLRSQDRWHDPQAASLGGGGCSPAIHSIYHLGRDLHLPERAQHPSPALGSAGQADDKDLEEEHVSPRRGCLSTPPSSVGWRLTSSNPILLGFFGGRDTCAEASMGGPSTAKGNNTPQPPGMSAY